MTYRELFHKAARLLDRGKITVDEYEKMTKPLDRQVGALYQIRAEIESMDFDFGDYYDNTIEIRDMVCKVIDKYNGESEVE